MHLPSTGASQEILSFHPEFANIIKAPRFAAADQMSLKLVVDVASIELFADNGTTVMTAIFFPDQVLDQLSILSKTPLSIDSCWNSGIFNDRHLA
jgi:fructan beta-fructosidase